MDFLVGRAKLGFVYIRNSIFTYRLLSNEMSADKIEINISPKCTTVLCVSAANKSVNHQKHTKLNMKIDTASLYAN